MKTFFLEQTKKTNWQSYLKPKVRKNDNKIIINKNLKNAKFKTKIKIVKQIVKILSKENSRQIVLENNLKKDNEIQNLLFSYNINICNSKWITKKMLKEIIEEIIKRKQIPKTEISICINEIDTISENFIYEITKTFKIVNIITNHIGRFKKIEEEIYIKDGILINITNNKKRGLSKSKLIINIDFPKEIINQFQIYEQAIIIDLDGNTRIRKKRFNGSIISNFEFIFRKESKLLKYIKENELSNYDQRDICQALGMVPKGEIGGIIW